MDYKELIKKLRAHKIKTDFGRFSPDICRKAADAIENLQTERDAAVEDLKKYSFNSCKVCAEWKNGTCSRPGPKDCAGYNWWKWRGPQKGDGNGG